MKSQILLHSTFLSMYYTQQQQMSCLPTKSLWSWSSIHSSFHFRRLQTAPLKIWYNIYEYCSNYHKVQLKYGHLFIELYIHACMDTCMACMPSSFVTNRAVYTCDLCNIYWRNIKMYVSNHMECFYLHPVHFRRQLPHDNYHFVFVSLQSLSHYSVLVLIHKIVHIIVDVVECYPYHSCSAKEKINKYKYCQHLSQPVSVADPLFHLLWRGLW